MFRPCLLIPVYNHGPLIEATYERLRPFGLPCILVDDGSDRSTATVLDDLAAREPSITLLRLPDNGGKGAAVLHGMTRAQQLGFTHALQVDADGQHNTDDIPALLALARAEPDALISGAPQYGDDIPKSRLYGRYITHFWVWVETLSLEIVDSMCGFRVYPVAATCSLAQRERIGMRMDFDPEIMVRLYWAGTPVRFLPTQVSYPDNGISHFDVWRDNLRISKMHTRLVCTMLLRLPTLLKKRTVQKTHWSLQRERGSEWGMRFCLWSYRQFGAQILSCLLYPIIGWFFLFGGDARAASMQYLNRVLPRPASLTDSFRHFLSFGRSIVDKLSAWNGEIRHTNVRFHQRQLLLEQKASGKGCLILTSHLGNTDVCRALSNYVDGLRLNILLFTRHAQQINRILQDVNPESGLEIIQIDAIGPDTAMLLHEKIERGEFVVIAADRTSPTAMHRVTPAYFLGEPALFPQGPFILSALMECPIYLLFAIKNSHQSEGTYDIFVERFADQLAFPRRDRENLLAEVIQQYANRLQHYCRLAPLQWFNFFDFWQSARTSEAPVAQRGLSND